jgi:peptidoglycan/LPS O-acetylase OafA/YrhL
MTVLLSHARGLGGFGQGGVINGTTLGTIAVYGFFGISGYLIAMSALRNGTGRFFWQRCLRILPGFWICLIVTVAFFGVIGWLTQPHPHCGFSCYFGTQSGGWDYLYRNWLLKINQTSIAGTPSGVSLRLIWNGSLGTLWYEFLCYLILGLVAAAGLLRRRVFVLAGTVALWVVITIITLTPSYASHFNVYENWWIMYLAKLGLVFAVGAVAMLYRDRLPDSGWLALGCAGLFVASLWLPTGSQVPEYYFSPPDLLTPLVVYPLIWLGVHLPFQRIGAQNDYSYGIYIYAYPVSQLLAMLGATRWGETPYLLLTVLATLPFAVASWWLVEKRALALKKVDPKVVAMRFRVAHRHGVEGPRTEAPVSSDL